MQDERAPGRKEAQIRCQLASKSQVNSRAEHSILEYQCPRWTETKATMNVKKVLPRLLLVIVSTSLSFGFCEIIFRAMAKDSHKYSVATTDNPFHFYRFDDVLGWSNNPKFKGTLKREEFTTEIEINEFGMRQRNVTKEKPDGKYRIAVMGDSFIWGIGVSDDQRVTELLARDLDNVDVLNFGVAGYSPLHFYLTVDEVVTFKPDLVLLFFCLGNDYEDNVLSPRYGYNKPYAELDENQKLVISGYPVKNVSKRRRALESDQSPTLMGSQLLAAGREVYERLTLHQSGLVGFDREYTYKHVNELSDEQIKLRNEAIAINEAILSGIHDRLAKHDIELIVVPAPTKREYNERQHYGHEGYYLGAENTLNASSEKLGITMIRTARHLRGEDFWVEDGHWNPGGHAKIADLVAAYLREHELEGEL
jgi:lysophospholipase L1-like esterase